jgi:hypothetical protein
MLRCRHAKLARLNYRYANRLPAFASERAPCVLNYRHIGAPPPTVGRVFGVPDRCGLGRAGNTRIRRSVALAAGSRSEHVRLDQRGWRAASIRLPNWAARAGNLGPSGSTVA